MQTSEFLHLLGHFRVPLVTGTSSKGNGTTRQFRGSLYCGMFSLGLGGGCGLSFSSFPSSFSISSTCQVGHFESHIWNFSTKFVNFVRRLLDVTSSLGRSFSSSTNESGCSCLGCHYPVMML